MSTLVEVRQLEIPGLVIMPTIASYRDEQHVHQCAQCGTVVVTPDQRPIGDCPTCEKRPTSWWRQPTPTMREGIAGVRLDDGSPFDVCAPCGGTGFVGGAS